MMSVPAVKVFCGASRRNQSYAFVVNTCTGTDNDYSPGPYNITLSSGDIRAFFNISIKDDIILETDEEFWLSINPLSLPTSITVGSGSNATVIIVDNNGKCKPHISV